MPNLWNTLRRGGLGGRSKKCNVVVQFLFSIWQLIKSEAFLNLSRVITSVTQSVLNQRGFSFLILMLSSVLCQMVQFLLRYYECCHPCYFNMLSFCFVIMDVAILVISMGKVFVSYFGNLLYQWGRKTLTKLLSNSIISPRTFISHCYIKMNDRFMPQPPQPHYWPNIGQLKCILSIIGHLYRMTSFLGAISCSQTNECQAEFVNFS